MRFDPSAFRMKFSTQIRAVCPKTGRLLDWMGPVIEAASWDDAESYCQNNGQGYCKITGEWISEQPADREIDLN